MKVKIEWNDNTRSFLLIRSESTKKKVFCPYSIKKKKENWPWKYKLRSEHLTTLDGANRNIFYTAKILVSEGFCFWLYLIFITRYCKGFYRRTD